MNKLVLSALAASVAIGTTNASEGDWAGLDAELNTLTTSLDNHGGPHLSGYIEADYQTAGEYTGIEDADDVNSDFGTGRMGLSVSGTNGGYGYHMDINGSDGISGSLAGDDLTVTDERDAYVTFTMGGIGWTMGQFRAPTTANHLQNEEDMLFTNRSALGGAGNRNTGLMASGSMDALAYWIHLGEDEGLTARVAYDVMSGEGINLSVAYSMDDSDTSDGADSFSWIEANVSSGPFSLAVTIGDDDTSGYVAGTNLGGSGAMVAVASYEINANWTVSLRSTDADIDDDILEGTGVSGDTSDWAVNYNDGGARWTIQSTGNPIDEGDDVMTVGVIVGF